ncbi:MAG TPA: molybdenum ABC transporter ATP-binding protein [Pseudolabrys sp.]|nr:molybdenum ABC transporter ATP-binding protein [Pseudolabrys sp.]
MSAMGRIDVAIRDSLGRFALDAAFDVPAEGVTALFGPSGCGKTTVLRCIAGLHRPADGHCAINGDVWHNRSHFRPAHKRPVGYVFQEASLFPHLSVRRNLLYGAPQRPGCSNDIHFDEVVELLGLHGMLERAPHKLSGGERQRVAIGRALLSQPKLLLMDEPLSALDRQTKDEILPFLERLHAGLALPIVYVSHDIAEVERLADHLVLMRAGTVIASGTFDAIRSDPSLPLAQARDAAVTLHAAVTAYDEKYGLATMEVEGGRFVVPLPQTESASHHHLTIAAGNVSLAREAARGTSILNILPARIVSASAANEYETIVLLRLGRDGTGSRVLARITRRSWDELEFAPGATVFCQVKGVSLAPA